MSALTSGIIPPMFFAILWGVISLSFFLIAFKLSIAKSKQNPNLLLDKIRKEYDL